MPRLGHPLASGSARPARLEGGAAQRVAAADHTIESLVERRVACVAFRFKFGVTAAAARRLSSHPLCGLSSPALNFDSGQLLKGVPLGGVLLGKSGYVKQTLGVRRQGQ